MSREAEARAERARTARRIRRLWRGGMSEAKIAEATSTTRWRVFRTLERLKASAEKVKARRKRIRNKARQQQLDRPTQRVAQQLRNMGLSAVETGKALNQSERWVRKWTVARTHRRKTRRQTAKKKRRLEELREAYRSGVATRELIRFFGTSWETVDKALQGEPRRGRGGATKGKPPRQAMTAGNVRRRKALRRATWENEHGAVPRGGNIIAIRQNLPEEYETAIWNLALVSSRTNTTLGRRAAKARREGQPITDEDRRDAIRKTAEELGDRLFAFGTETTPPEAPDGSTAED